MRIGIDAKPLESPDYTGIPRYLHEILRVWAKKYPDHEYYLYSTAGIHTEFELPDNWHVVVQRPFPGFLRKLWGTIQLPVLIKKDKVDVLWAANYALPPKVSGVRYFVTVYDVALLLFRGIGTAANELKVRIMTGPACRRAEKVFTISESTAKDIVKCIKIPPSKIEVCYCGGLPQSKNVLSKGTAMHEGNYFLFVSTIEPRKNVLTLIKAFEMFLDQTGSDMDLVLVGKIGWKCEDVLRYREKSRYKDRIWMPGYVTAEEKDKLYRNAKAFVFPSLYEGFGIPVLEAFSYGLPVITANNSSLPEVGGDAAFYVQDAKNPAELAGLMKEVTFLSEEQKNELLRKMEKQLSKFSWDESAEKMMKVLRGVSE